MGFYDKLVAVGQKAITQAAITYSAYQVGKTDENENNQVKTIEHIAKINNEKPVVNESHILEYLVFSCIGIAILLIICIFFKLYMKKTLLTDRIIRMSTLRRGNENNQNQNQNEQ